MGLKTFTTDFVELKKISGLFLTTRIKEYRKNHNSDFLPFSYFVDTKNTYSLGQIKKEEYKTSGDFPIVDQSQEFIAGYSDEEDLVYTGKLPAIIFGDHTRIFKYVDFHFIQGADGIKVIKPNEEIVNPKFFYYLLSKIGVPSRGYNRHFSILKKQKYPKIPKPKQDQIVAQIEPIEKKIKDIKIQITPPQEIINKVFAREFEFDLERFEELKKEMFFKVDLKNFANHSDLRFSVSDFRNYLIFKGSSKIIPQDKFSEISIKDISIKHKCTNLKKGELDKANLLVELENVSNHNGQIFDIKEVEEIGSDKLLFADADILTTKLRPYLGKTILNNFDEEAIGTTEWIPLKIDQTKIIKEYLFYILLSNLYTEKAILLMSGKNHPRIKPEILFDFKIPNIDLSTQQKIVNEIKAEFDKQEEIKKNIEAERNKIDEIIENTITETRSLRRKRDDRK